MVNNLEDVDLKLSVMKEYITNIDNCTSKVREVIDGGRLYRMNYKINILTIVTTVYTLACAILRLNEVLLFAGVALAGIILMCGYDVPENSIYIIGFVLNVTVIICSIIFFMYSFTFIPIFVLFAQWIYTIICNYKLKIKIWEILKDL